MQNITKKIFILVINSNKMLIVCDFFFIDYTDPIIDYEILIDFQLSNLVYFQTHVSFSFYKVYLILMYRY